MRVTKSEIIILWKAASYKHTRHYFALAINQEFKLEHSDTLIDSAGNIKS